MESAVISDFLVVIVVGGGVSRNFCFLVVIRSVIFPVLSVIVSRNGDAICVVAVDAGACGGVSILEVDDDSAAAAVVLVAVTGAFLLISS